MNLGEKIAASKRAWDRKDSEFYPTPTETTQALIDWIVASVTPEPMTIREPCCGEGHMSEVLRAAGHTVDSSDIRHTGYGDGGIDYVKLRENSATSYDYDAVVTNPPFNTAEAIIRRALRDAPLVAMLLSNNYWHAASRSRLFNSRKPMAVLALTWRPAFLEAERGTSPLANMIWTVWNDRTEGTDTQYVMLQRPEVYPGPLEVTSTVELGRTGLLGDLTDAMGANLDWHNEPT